MRSNEINAYRANNNEKELLVTRSAYQRSTSLADIQAYIYIEWLCHEQR